MSGVQIVVGVDPGPVPGTVGLLIEDRKITDVQLAQTSAGLVGLTVSGIVMRWRNWATLGENDTSLIAVERFVTRGRASKDQALTRDMVGVMLRCGEELGVPVVQRNASQVKTWATDERLERAGIEIPKGMRHAKDGARHALYAAVHAGHLPDPMSTTYRKS